MNQYTPWFINKQTTPHRLRILENPSSRSIDIQIPTQRGQTCIEAIQLTLQIIGCQQGQIHFDNGEIQVFTSNHTPNGGLDHPVSTESELTGLLLLQHYSIVKPNARLTMFLPEETNTTTWASACLAEDTEIRLPDGTFAPLQHSLGKKIWTDQPNSRNITRIHKFDTLETDPPLYLIEGNWMTESHFIRGKMEPKWHRASEFRGNSDARRTTPKGPVFAVELDTDDYLTLRGGI